MENEQIDKKSNTKTKLGMFATHLGSFWSPQTLKKSRNSLHEIDKKLKQNKRIYSFHKKEKHFLPRKKQCIITSNYFHRKRISEINSFGRSQDANSGFQEAVDSKLPSTQTMNEKKSNQKKTKISKNFYFQSLESQNNRTKNKKQSKTHFIDKFYIRKDGPSSKSNVFKLSRKQRTSNPNLLSYKLR
jgi:hypothetical protein